MSGTFLPSEYASSDGGSTIESDDTERSRLAAKETQFVRCTKALVLVILAASASVTSYLTFRVLSDFEEQQFRKKFENYAKELAAVSTISANTLVESIGDFSITLTSYAIGTNSTWPFVAIPHFSARGEQFVKLTGSTLVSANPFLYEEELAPYEVFIQANEKKIVDVDPRPPGDNTPLFSPVIAPIVPNITLAPTPGIKERPIYHPVLHVYPLIPPIINLETLAIPSALADVRTVVKTRSIFVAPITSLLSESSIPGSWPTSAFNAPIYRDLEQTSDVVGLTSAAISWHQLFSNILPENGESLDIVFVDTCGGEVTYRAYGGSNVTFVGSGDHHDPGTGNYAVSLPIDVFGSAAVAGETQCLFSATFFPTSELLNTAKTDEPINSSVIVAMAFLITTIFFVAYDFLVQKRQRTVETTARRTGAIVESFFPKSVLARLEEARNVENNAGNQSRMSSNALHYVDSKTSSLSRQLLASKPIADLFPRVTVMFADVSGFTAWASARQPAEVFMLLEQIFSIFDGLAKNQKIFKVETVSDSYVAAAGLPEEKADHAQIMARFANDCRNKMKRILRDLEVILGPDTTELQIRIGIHSGQVTGGVLRGEKSRFQLFGDTVNTASRIERAGEPGQIHLSKQTADILIANGWLSVGRKRDSRSVGITTIISTSGSVEQSENDSLGGSSSSKHDDGDKSNRLIDWNVDMLYRQLQQIAAVRSPDKNTDDSPTTFEACNPQFAPKLVESTVLDEVREIIALPSQVRSLARDPAMIDLGPIVKDQLRNFVATVSGMYNLNSFHSFEHASHVTQSVMKLMSRIVGSNQIDYTNMKYKRNYGAHELHDHTFGITSDPLTQFACLFSALVHDLDHQGVPNTTLVAEGAEIAAAYRNKSVAEQNSVDLAWSLLMEPMYEDLRRAIYTTEDELVRFRQLVVNSVMATDIVDKELGAARKARWAKAFQNNSGSKPSSDRDIVNRKATIVIEHLIQASDVSHTMQHWHVYIKWNEKLFHELYTAFLDGRIDTDPSIGWVKGEIGFFDFYIIPLAKKLADCGVFGVSSDEYLQYARQNRAEWEREGERVLKRYMTKYIKK